MPLGLKRRRATTGNRRKPARNAIEPERLAKRHGGPTHVLLFLEPAGMSWLAADIGLDHGCSALSARHHSVLIFTPRVPIHDLGLRSRRFRNLGPAGPLSRSRRHGEHSWKAPSSENSTRAAAQSLRSSMSCRNAACREATCSFSRWAARTRRAHARQVPTSSRRLRLRVGRSWTV